MKFTKSIFAVELEGKPFGIALPPDKMEILLAMAAKLSEGESLSLHQIPNQHFFESVTGRN